MVGEDSARCTQCGKPARVGSDLCGDCQTEATIDTSRTPIAGEPLPPTFVGAPTTASDAPQNAAASYEGEFGDYELLEEVARGGMGVVYRARHKKLNRQAALKMILGGRFSSADDVQRFHVEAEAAAQLDHVGIVPIYEIGEHEGLPFFAMKFVEGGSLAEHRERFRQDPRAVVRLVASVARAVHHAHQRGILHRDLKPANILLDDDDNPLLTDLGLAKSTTGGSDLTRTGAVVGTPSYMPPEQAKAGNTITTAADIYSLGAILYELLTGQPPHQGESAVETVMQVLNEPITPPREVQANVDRDLELVCMKCLERVPEQRYETAAALADDLERWLAGAAISVRPPSVVAVVAQWMRRNQKIGYAVLVLLAATIFSFPIIFLIFGKMGDPQSLYAGTAEDPMPWVFTLTASIPPWLSATSGMVALLLWPFVGMLVTMVTKPRNWQHASLNGAIFGGATALLFALLLGWIMFLFIAQVEAQETIQTMAEAVWPSADTDNDIEAELIDQFPRLEELPEAERAGYISSRILADALAVGPQIWVAIAIVAATVGGPILIGAVIWQMLSARGGNWLLMFLRYGVGWFASLIAMVVIIGAVINGDFNGVPFWELPLMNKLIVVVVIPMIPYLILRRWRRKKPS